MVSHTQVGSSGLTQMPRIVGLVEHVETSSEVKQWLVEQEEVVRATPPVYVILVGGPCFVFLARAV